MFVKESEKLNLRRLGGCGLGKRTQNGRVVCVWGNDVGHELIGYAQPQMELASDLHMG